MPIDALKRIFQVPEVKKESGIGRPPQGRKRPKQQEEKEKKPGKGIDIRV